MLTIRTVFEKMKKIYHWFFDDEYVLTEICTVFTAVTVINSYQMVFLNHMPKVGKFAYIHLLIRLLIISVIVTLIEGENIFQEIKQIILRVKSSKTLSKSEIRAVIYRYIIDNKVNTISISFSSLTVIICLIMTVFVIEPQGGEKLYFNLLILFGIVTATVLIVHIFDKIKNTE